ncbi:MAG: hypothetical protein WAM14_18955 [Candidatus Nitrosopolaris sp.]
MRHTKRKDELIETPGQFGVPRQTRGPPYYIRRLSEQIPDSVDLPHDDDDSLPSFLPRARYIFSLILVCYSRRNSIIHQFSTL